ncbi:MAG: hypothetical protein AB1414_14850 [bacterium]
MMLNKILIIVAIIVGLFLVGLITDVIRLHLIKNRVEGYLEEIIKEGAILIDTPRATNKKIKQMAKNYGILLNDEEIIISPSLNKITINKSLSLNTYFAWLVGKKTITLFLQKQAEILRTICPITELETISLGIIRPSGLNFGFLYKLALQPETNLLEEKLVALDFGSAFSKTLKVGNIFNLRELKENELEELVSLFTGACKSDCRINNFSPQCPKLLKIPVVEIFKPIPSMVKVVGFACFFIEEGDNEIITGYFVEHYQPGVSDDRVSHDFGLRTRSKIEIIIKYTQHRHNL